MTEELNENEVTEVTENEQEQIQTEQERLEQERLEQERLELERQEAEERAREQARIEHENFLNSFPDTTVFYQELKEEGNVKWLCGTIKNPFLAESYGWIDNHYDESELTLIRNIYYLKGYEKHEKTLDELKAEKIKRISEHADLFEQSECKEMYIISSLGFRANADRRSLQNLDNLILLNEPVRFRDYDNVFHPPFPEEPNFSIENLKILRLEMARNGHNLYEQKFLKQISIMNAETVEQVEGVIEDFVMTDFSQSNQE